MPRHVQVLRFCENHPNEPATENEYTMSLGHGRARLFDVCEECEKTLVTPMIELLAKGTPVEAAPGGTGAAATGGKRKSRAKRSPCPKCDQVLKDRQGLSVHLRTQHDTSISALKAEGIDI